MANPPGLHTFGLWEEASELGIGPGSLALRGSCAGLCATIPPRRLVDTEDERKRLIN